MASLLWAAEGEHGANGEVTAIRNSEDGECWVVARGGSWRRMGCGLGGVAALDTLHSLALDPLASIPVNPEPEVHNDGAEHPRRR